MPLFAGSHTTIADFLGGNTNFVIPEFQREYSWKEENVEQLLRDLQHGISKLVKSDSDSQREVLGSKFLGCVIQWDRDAVEGLEYVPATGISFITRGSELIDGQQRTSTMILLLCEMYLLLEQLLDRLDRTIHEENELARFVQGVQASWLLPRFARAGKSSASPSHRPALIRQGVDKWIHAGTSQYKSSIASYVHQLVVAIDGGGELSRPAVVGDDIKDVVLALRERLEECANHPCDYLATNYDQSELFDSLTTGRNAVNLIGYLGSGPTNLGLIKGIVDVVAIAHYLLNYCAVTLITSANQDTALDMFQSLNATGVQLTAVQLLKPWISQSFRNDGQLFSSDPMFKHYNDVNDWLNRGRNSTAKTFQFFLKFGLAIFGEEPTNSLSSQRSWLLKSFRAYTSNGVDVDKIREFIRLMRHVADYLEHFEFKTRDSLFEGSGGPPMAPRKTYLEFRLVHRTSGTSFPLSDPAIATFMFIIDAKHDLAHAFLSSSYAHFQESSAANALAAKQEFEKLLFSVAACFVVWRGSFKEKYPDAAYRNVLSKRNYLNFSGKAREIGTLLSIELRKKRKSIAPGISFIELMADGLQYKSGTQAIARFVLILAAHRKTALNIGGAGFVEHGLVVSDAAGPDYLYPDIWLGAEYKSVEHVAPQKLLGWTGAPIAHWSSTFKNASTSVHSIGNLTLLSAALNASTPEDTPAKTNHYGALVAPGAAAGVTPTASALMASSPLLSHLVPIYIRLEHWIADIGAGRIPSQNNWDEQFIRRRAINVSAEVLKDLVKWIRAV